MVKLGPTNGPRPPRTRQDHTREVGSGPTGEQALPTSLAPGPGGREEREEPGGPGQARGKYSEMDCPRFQETGGGSTPTQLTGNQGASWEHCGLPQRTEWLGGQGSSRQPSGHCPAPPSALMAGGQASPGGSAYRRRSCLDTQEEAPSGRCPAWRQDQRLQEVLPGFPGVPDGSAHCRRLEIHPRASRGLRGQVSREQSCCRLCSASSPTARVTPEARPAHVLAAGQALRVLAPAPQHLLRPADASLERGADRKTPGMGPAGEKQLLGARHRLLFQTAPQGQCLRPRPC